MPENWIGHKHMSCHSWLITSVFDGLIGLALGAEAGSENDHALKNHSDLGGVLWEAQQGQPQIYTTGTDKGMHADQCVGSLNAWIIMRCYLRRCKLSALCPVRVACLQMLSPSLTESLLPSTLIAEFRSS